MLINKGFSNTVSNSSVGDQSDARFESTYNLSWIFSWEKGKGPNRTSQLVKLLYGSAAKVLLVVVPVSASVMTGCRVLIVWWHHRLNQHIVECCMLSCTTRTHNESYFPGLSWRKHWGKSTWQRRSPVVPWKNTKRRKTTRHNESHFPD